MKMKNGLNEMCKFFKNNNITFLDRNTLISNLDKPKVIDILLNGLKSKVGEIVADEDIIGDYSMLKNKGYEIDDIYLKIKNNLLGKELYRINFDSSDLSEYDREMWKYLEDKSYILPNMITDSYKEFFDISIKGIFDKIKRINLENENGDDLIKSYFDIDHDLVVQEKMVLAYYMSRNTLSEENKIIIKEQLAKGGDTEEFFIKQFGNSYDFFQNSLNNTFDFIK